MSDYKNTQEYKSAYQKCYNCFRKGIPINFTDDTVDDQIFNAALDDAKRDADIAEELDREENKKRIAKINADRAKAAEERAKAAAAAKLREMRLKKRLEEREAERKANSEKIVADYYRNGNHRFRPGNRRY